MARCYFCGGDVVRGKKTFTITRGDYYVIIRDIQTDVCSGCGEAYYGVEQGRAIEEILRTLDDQVKRLQAPVPSTKP